MKTTLVPIAPPKRALLAGRTGLAPEVLAATAARISRNNEGLEAILKMLDPDEDRSVEKIFQFIDYGHASIGDNAPVAIFMDGVTISLAFQIWNVCPTACGVESSTRYLRMDTLPGADDLGIPAAEQAAWEDLMGAAFAAYERMLDLWTGLAVHDPKVTRIPAALLADPSPKVQKQVDRMRRNFAFDRARVFLPAAGFTNMVLIMPATGWVRLVSWLLSHPALEARMLAHCLRSELELVVPHLIRHMRRQEEIVGDLADEAEAAGQRAQSGPDWFEGDHHLEACVSASLEAFTPSDVCPATDFPRALRHHSNRYAPVGSALRRTLVRYAWRGMGLAEIRDLNRHRTGSRYSSGVPVGFHAAQDQVPGRDVVAFHEDELVQSLRDNLNALQAKVGGASLRHARRALIQRRADAPYWHLLGSQFDFEHGTTADKYIYERELRTGNGTHYRYCDHHRAAGRLWDEQFPETVGLIHEGLSEPE